MKFMSLIVAMAIGLPGSATAAQESPAGSARQEAKATAEAQSAAEAKIEAGYQKAMAEAERSQSKAQAAIAEARSQLEQATRQKEQANQISAERRAEMEAMRESLNRAHQELRESSRELSQINRELVRVERNGGNRRFVISGGDQPVLGVILGKSSDTGIKVLGVSPNGPAEKGGVLAGDVIIAVAGRVLSSVDASGDVRTGLNVALADMEATEPVIVSVERGTETLDLSVVPEVREPLAWHSVMRLPSIPAAPAAPSASALPAAPSSPASPVIPDAPSKPMKAVIVTDADGNTFVERMDVPEINRAELAEQIERMEVQIEQRGDRNLSGTYWAAGDADGYAFYFDDMSELGDIALSDTNAWFGMPLTSGLRLAEIDPALGEYFNTERGVLVLKAKPDNALQLKVGDVVLSLQGAAVNSPADFMRALREFSPGDEIRIDIKRKRKNETLKPVISDQQARFFAPHDFENFEVIVDGGDW
jgi:C-terminal processing protease CtpA/Prc